MDINLFGEALARGAIAIVRKCARAPSWGSLAV